MNSVNDLPPPWDPVPLGRVSTLTRGVSYKPSDLRDPTDPEAVALLRATNIKDGQLVLDRDLVHVVPRKVKDPQVLLQGDVVVAMSSGSTRVVGKTAQLRVPWFGTAGAFCAILRPDPREVDSEFFGFVLQTTAYRSHIESAARGTNIKNLSRDHILDYTVSLPPIPEQKAIARVLRTVQRASEETERVLTATHSLKASAIEHLFSSSGSGDWAHQELGDLVEPTRPLCYGIVQPGPAMPDGVGFLNVQDLPNVGNGAIELQQTAREIDEAYARSRLRTGDLLLGIRGSIGRVAIVPQWLDGVNIARQIARISLQSTIDRRYVYYFLQSRAAQQFLRKSTKGVGHTGINLRDLKHLLVPVAPKVHQEQIARNLEVIDRRIEAEQSARESLKHLFKTLMEELTTGRSRLGALPEVA